MSAKWVRSQRWDDEHLTGWLTPVKVIVRLFSSIPLAIVLLVLVALYGILASVPVGLIAQIPTQLVYGATLLGTVFMAAVVPVWVLSRILRKRGVKRGVRFAVAMFGLIVLAGGAVMLWYATLWPALRYDAATGKGLRLFAGFTQQYQSVQARRLPGMEMSELEFYAWWPLALVLVLFVINLVVATLRRIEFSVPNIGVLTVHTGIVTIALGSVYYTSHKQEGDVLLLGGGLAEDGQPIAGRPESGFYDNTRIALWVTQDRTRGREGRPLAGVPRYNDYNLDVVPRADTRPAWSRSLGPLSIEVPDGLAGEHAPDGKPVVDPDIRFRVVGYASYAELQDQVVSGSAAGGSARTTGTGRMRSVEATVATADSAAGPPPKKVWRLMPDSPAGRMDELDVLAIEYTIGMARERWADLNAELPEGSVHGLVVEIPASNFRAVYAVQPGQVLKIGDTGYTLTVQDIQPAPPFPIVTKGYQGATSSLAVVKVQPPAAADGTPGRAFDRWVYHRFPEISQDLLEELNERGMPKRRDADPSIRIGYIDASMIQVYLDEQPDGTVRSLVRFPGGMGPSVRTSEGLKSGDKVQVAPALALTLGEQSDNAAIVEVPVVVPPAGRDKNRLGNHQAAAIAVEISDKSGQKQIVWLPFAQYLDIGSEAEREVKLADGRKLWLTFGRERHGFWPPMTVRLRDFEMIPYPHSDVPRDYRSEVIVSTRWGGQYKDTLRTTSLNEPLLVRTPFVGREDAPAVTNFAGWVMSFIAPNQYKFSQAGWDQQGWRESEAAVRAGQAKRAAARYTILGVGNNPGIYIIASGAIMMSVGIPWAFYLKPVLVRRKKRKLQEAVARGEIVARGPGTRAAAGAASMNGTVHEPEEVRR